MGANDKQMEILSLAAKLMAKKGYKGTSFQEIADNVGLHKSSLFHYFKNKGELLLRILEKPIEEVTTKLELILSDVTLSPEQKFQKAVDNHLSLLTSYIDNVNVYLNDLRSLPEYSRNIYIIQRKKYEDNFQQIIEDMKKNGYFYNCDARLTTFGILGMLNWTSKWYKSGGRLSVREISDTFCRIILHPHNNTVK